LGSKQPSGVKKSKLPEGVSPSFWILAGGLQYTQNAHPSDKNTSPARRIMQFIEKLQAIEESC
jgi:hypothetical protein